MTAQHNDQVFGYLNHEVARLSKSRGDRGYIKGYLVENPSNGKFVVTVMTPKGLYGAGSNVFNFLLAFQPFIKLDVETGVVGEEKFTKYIITT